MIRSSKITLKFANKIKLDKINSFIDEYQNAVSQFVNLFWNMEKIPAFVPKNCTQKINTWLSARALQCAGKQASGIVRGTKKKQQKREWMIGKLEKEGKFKQARKLQNTYNKTKMTKPNIQTVKPELDARFVKIEWNSKTGFDGWMTISSIGNKTKITIPLKKSKHLNKLLDKGKLKTGVRISKNEVTLMLELPNPEPVTTGIVLGVDIGQKTTISCSNGFAAKPDKHGHDLNSITDRLTRKRKGSKAFQKCCTHRTNYVNWSVNQLDLGGVKQVNIERIKHLRKGKNTSRRLKHWTYTEIFGKLESRCEEQGVLVCKVTPTYTSQRCSACGWTSKRNRKGKAFKCEKCFFKLDSDLNASRNIALPLVGITKQQLLKRANRTGFYWLVEGQEFIVPVVPEYISTEKHVFQ
jgi:putative transposase